MWEVLKNTQLWFGGSSHPYANGFKLRLKELRQAGSCLYLAFREFLQSLLRTWKAYSEFKDKGALKSLGKRSPGTWGEEGLNSSQKTAVCKLSVN